MLHAPIRTKGAASRLTENWIGPFVVTADNGHKNYAIQHIDAGTTARHGVHNLCALPPELFKGEYHERLVAMRRKDPLPSTSINAKDMPLVKTLRGVCLAGVWQVLDDATIHVHWYNGVHGRLQPPARVYPAYLGESAKLREVFTMPPYQRPSSSACLGHHCLPTSDRTAPHSARKENRPPFPPHFRPNYNRRLAPFRSSATAQESQPKSVYYSS
jgi:hypothetical protein